MKVLHLETGNNLYGGALQVLYLVRGLQSRGIDNILVCPKNSAIAKAASSHSTIVDIPFKGELDARLLARLIVLMRRIHPDLVHIHSRRGADIWGGLAARLAGIPVILTRRVDNPEPRWWVRGKYRLYDRILTISEGIKNVLLSEGVPEHKLACARSAIDPEPYQQSGDRHWFQQEFNLPENALSLGVIAQFIARKGHRFLLDAAPDLLRLHNNLYMLFFGRGALENNIRKQAKNMGVADRCIFAGFRHDLPRLLPSLDLVVHPALMEGLGVSLIQAAAAGVPVVAFRAGGIPEIVHAGKNGFLVEPADTEAMKQAIHRCLADAKLRKQLGIGGRQLVQERFSLDAMVEKNLAEYRKILQSE